MHARNSPRKQRGGGLGKVSARAAGSQQDETTQLSCWRCKSTQHSAPSRVLARARGCEGRRRSALAKGQHAPSVQESQVHTPTPQKVQESNQQSHVRVGLSTQTHSHRTLCGSREKKRRAHTHKHCRGYAGSTTMAALGLALSDRTA